MKKVLILLVLLWGLSWGSLEASSSGKNLLNPALFTLSNHVLENTEAISVEGGETYTLSLPEYYAIDLVHVKVVGVSNEIYIDELVNVYQNCDLEGYYTVCSFVVGPSESGVLISFSEGFITQWYQYYEMYDFQLEKNPVRTAYEPYLSGSGETQGPVMQGAGNITVSYARNVLLATLIEENIQAHDNIDGDITDQIRVLDDAYSGHENITGRYSVLLSVSDTSGNTTLFELVIDVVDNVPPVISGPSSVDVQIDLKPLINDLIANHFTFNDVYTGAIQTFEVLSDAYTEATGVGEYAVSIRIEDLSGNRSERTFFVQIRSDLPPVMEGPDTVRLYLSETPNAQKVTQLFSALDKATAAELAIDLVSTTLDDWMKSGRFQGTLSVTDSFDNVSTRTITIVIIDDIPPIFTYDNQIVIPLGTSMQSSAMMEMVIQYYEDQGIDVSSLRIIHNDYEGNEFKEGSYPFTVEVLSFTGEAFIHQGRISVETLIDDPDSLWPLKTLGYSALMGTLGLSWFILRKRLI
jgi:hypothetical protein